MIYKDFSCKDELMAMAIKSAITWTKNVMAESGNETPSLTLMLLGIIEKLNSGNIINCVLQQMQLLDISIRLYIALMLRT